jgi:hypothetical protein
MKIARFDGGRIGVVIDGTLRDVTRAAGIDPVGWPPVGLLRLIANFAALRNKLARAAGAAAPVRLADARPAHKFPYRAAAGALYDSGDFPRAVATAIGDGPARRPAAPARCRACCGKALRHRLCRRDRAGQVQHGLSLDAAHDGCPRTRRAEERGGLHGRHQCRSARRGRRHGRRDRIGPRA